MDVGEIVDYRVLISAVFALLAGIALFVELGKAPKKEKPKVIELQGAEAKEESPKPAEAKVAPPQPPVADPQASSKVVALLAGKPVISTAATPPVPPEPPEEENGGIPSKSFLERPVVEKTLIEKIEDVAAAPQPPTMMETIADLQRTYVDGLLGHRGKYDVALAILNEYQASELSNKDTGLTMASDAYLSATRTSALTAHTMAAKKEVEKKDSKKDEGNTQGAAKKNAKVTAGDTKPGKPTARRKSGEADKTKPSKPEK